MACGSGGGVACHLMLKDLFKLQHLWRTVAFRCQQHKASVRAVSLGLKSPGEGGGDTYRRQPQCPPCGIVTAFSPWENQWEEPVRAQDSAPQVRAAAGRYGAALPVPPVPGSHWKRKGRDWQAGRTQRRPLEWKGVAQCGKSPLLCNGTCVGTSSPGTEELLGPLRKERFGEFQAPRRPRGWERTLPALRAQLAAGWHPGERAQRRPGTAIRADGNTGF